MDANRAAEELQVIRALMERPIRYSSMSGASGIMAGVAAIAGLAANWLVLLNWPGWGGTILLTGLIWLGVFAVALACTLGLTYRRDRVRGMPFWTPAKRRVLTTVVAPFAGGVGLTAMATLMLWQNSALDNDVWMLIAPGWMLFYGVALWQIGQFSPPEVHWLGVAFLLAGLVSGMVPPLACNPDITLGASFGGFHLVYGVIVWHRYGG